MTSTDLRNIADSLAQGVKSCDDCIGKTHIIDEVNELILRIHNVARMVDGVDNRRVRSIA